MNKKIKDFTEEDYHAIWKEVCYSKELKPTNPKVLPILHDKGWTEINSNFEYIEDENKLVLNFIELWNSGDESFEEQVVYTSFYIKEKDDSLEIYNNSEFSFLVNARDDASYGYKGLNKQIKNISNILIQQDFNYKTYRGYDEYAGQYIIFDSDGFVGYEDEVFT